MDLGKYLESVEGLGILSTADDKGKVNAALYARPHAMGIDKVAFIMADHLSRANINKNPSAVYLFKENGPGYGGVRLYLEKDTESTDLKQLKELSRRRSPSSQEDGDHLKTCVLVTFKVLDVRPLVGNTNPSQDCYGACRHEDSMIAWLHRKREIGINSKLRRRYEGY